jgi:NhaP-type Na+/H+ or K+/H+ antiporter
MTGIRMTRAIGRWVFGVAGVALTVANAIRFHMWIITICVAAGLGLGVPVSYLIRRVRERRVAEALIREVSGGPPTGSCG